MLFVVMLNPRRRASQLYPKHQRFSVSLHHNVFNTRDIAKHSSVAVQRLLRMLL